MLYNNEIKTSGNYSKIFDFSNLEDRVYSAELNKAFEILIKQFYVKDGFITFLNNNYEKYLNLSLLKQSCQKPLMVIKF